LLSAFDMVGAERDGRIALAGVEPIVSELALDALALPDEGKALTRDRDMAARPSMARVRFIDEGAAYQIGSATLRSDGDGGTVDIDLAAVCGAEIAEAVALRMLAAPEATDRLTINPGPLEALRLEAGDRVRLEGQGGDWRIERLSWDETPTAVLSPVLDVKPGEARTVWRRVDGPALVGAPFLAILDLPPLPGHETDDRPLAVVAGDPWRPMQIFAGAGAETLTIRGEASAPARVGRLMAPLAAGVLNRWDAMNAILVHVEGGQPSSLTDAAVLGGANAITVETSEGWEIVQFRTAEVVGGGVWRLAGLLRGQQGTDEAMRAGADAGAVVVFLDEAVSRVGLSSSEIGLPLVWRAGPRGASPGGAGTAERFLTIVGRHGRPWSPAHLRARRVLDGVRVTWMARSRTAGELWEGEPEADGPARFRMRVQLNDVVLRTIEVNGLEGLYALSDIATDFPDGVGPGASLTVSQSDGRSGWGAEARVGIPA